MVRRLRTVAKREVECRPEMHWRGWGFPFFERSLAPALRLAPAPVLAGFTVITPDFERAILTIFVAGTCLMVFHLAARLQWIFRSPIFLSLPYTLPMEDRAIHRHLANGLWRDVRTGVWDWLWFFGAIWFISDSSGVVSLSAVPIGAGVMAAMTLALASGLVLFLPQWINWSSLRMFAIYVLFMLSMLALHSSIPDRWIESLLPLLQTTPMWVAADWAMGAIRGGADQAGLLAILAAAMFAALYLLWQVSAARFDVAKQVGEVPEDDLSADAFPVTAPAPVERENIRASLRQELNRAPGTATSEQGLMGKSLVALSERATRHRLDLLQASGSSWGYAWWLALAGVGAATCVGRILDREEGYYLLVFILFAIPVAGGNWGLTQDRMAGPVAMHPWATYPVRATELGRAMLRANHLRLAFALPLVVCALWLMFPEKPALEFPLRIMVLLLAAMPLGVFSQFSAGVSIFGPRGKTSLLRIITILGMVFAAMFFGAAILLAAPPYAALVAATLLIITYAILRIFLRRVDAGKYDFL